MDKGTIMSDKITNHKAATEDEVGLIHNMATQLHILRLRKMLADIKCGLDPEAVIGDGKALQAAGKWAAEQNLITCASPEMNSESELSKQLAAIKAKQSGRGARANGTNNVIEFDDGGD